MTRAILLSLCLASAAPARAQEAAPSGPAPQVFLPVEYDWLTALVLEFPFYWFYVGGPAINGQAYLPNFRPRLGARVNYRDWGAQLTVGVPLLGRAEQKRRGDSTQSGGAINSYWRENAFDFNYQAFRGFYVSDPFTELRRNKPERYPQLPDTRVLNVGFNWYHAFRPDRYSFKAAFDNQEFQSASGGSWILNPYGNHFEMRMGTAFVPGSPGAAVTSLPNVASGRYDTLGCALGYGYTHVRGRYYLTTQGAFGPGVQYQRLDRADGGHARVLALAGKFNVNVSTGWNYPQGVGGLKLLVDSLSTRIVDVQVTSSLITAQLFFGYRF